MSYDTFDISETLYIHCTENHSGQGSYLYSLLSKIQAPPISFRPGLHTMSGEPYAGVEVLQRALRLNHTTPERLLLELEHAFGLLTDEQYEGADTDLLEQSDRDAQTEDNR